jgi:ribose 5-phosphate isomerase B
MRIAVAADHRGYEAKRKLVPALRQWGHIVEDFGCQTSLTCSDYPDYAIPLALAVAEGRCEAGILFDGSGIGMSIAANKVRGIRAALAHDEVTARLSREANHCNVLCLGSDLLNDAEIRKITQAFLSTSFGDGRHARRVQKLNDLERSQCQPPTPARVPAAPCQASVREL